MDVVISGEGTLQACMIIDRLQVLRKVFEKYYAKPTHRGAETIVATLADDMDEYAHNVAEIFDPVWERGDVQKVYGEQGGEAFIHPDNLQSVDFLHRMPL